MPTVFGYLQMKSEIYGGHSPPYDTDEHILGIVLVLVLAFEVIQLLSVSRTSTTTSTIKISYFEAYVDVVST